MAVPATDVGSGLALFENSHQPQGPGDHHAEAAAAPDEDPGGADDAAFPRDDVRAAATPGTWRAECQVDQITSMYQGTRLAQQELMAEIIETSEAMPGTRTSTPSRAASTSTPVHEYTPGLPIRIAIDCGVSPARRGHLGSESGSGSKYRPHHQRLRRLLCRR